MGYHVQSASSGASLIRPHNLKLGLLWIVAALAFVPFSASGASLLWPADVDGPAVTHPQVLGITAGVGMRPGEIEGAAPIAVSFSQAMDIASAQAAFSISPRVAGSFKWQQNTLIFTPFRPLTPNAAYTVNVSGNARTLSGKRVIAPLSARFQTLPPPGIVRTLPSAGASDVSTDTLLTLSFDRAMTSLTSLTNQPDVARWVKISPSVEGRWVWLGTAAVGFRASRGLKAAALYTVEVKSGWPDSSGVPLAQGSTFSFTTIRPSIQRVVPSNGEAHVPIDTPFVAQFNQPMDRASVQTAFVARALDLNAPLKGSYAWSADSMVMTFTASSLLEFDREYGVAIGGKVTPANGSAGELVGGAKANSWSFHTTERTEVTSHQPDDKGGLSTPQKEFAFYFNNPIAPGQEIGDFLTVDPAPPGYNGKLTLSSNASAVYAHEARLLANTVYRFRLRAGLKDKWGFTIPEASWQINIGPLPPSLEIKGGKFQPVYSDGPTRVRIQATNLATVTLNLSALTEPNIREAFLRSYAGVPDFYSDRVLREWEASVPASASGESTFYPTLALDEQSDRLPPGYYLLSAIAPTRYSDQPIYTRAVLIVGRTGVVTKLEGRNLLVWAADLGSGKPVPDYPVRVEQLSSRGAPVTHYGSTDHDGVLRLTLADVDYSTVNAVWGEQQGDALVATTDWSNNIAPGSYNFSGSYDYSAGGERAGIYTDRPIYRPGQTVYYRGVYRLDDDARYELRQRGASVTVRSSTYHHGERAIYTGTATLSPQGTFTGQFIVPDDAPTGSYSVRLDPAGGSAGKSYIGEIASAAFQVEEYRKPEFQVSVTAPKTVVQGDPVAATLQTSYYYGGPLVNVTTTVNVRLEPYRFDWSDPATGESYSFGNGSSYYSPSSPEAEDTPVALTARTDKMGTLQVDVRRYVQTNTGSKLARIEGQVQDLSNQTVASSGTTVIHQGLYYIGLRTSEYLATAGQPLTISVRTVDASGERTHPGIPVSLRVVRGEWVQPSAGDTEWKLNEVEVSRAVLATDAEGRATSVVTPPSGGDYTIYAESADSRGNKITTSTGFWAYTTDSGFIPWRYENPQQVELVADKSLYKAGETAHILVTSPFTQATGLLTIERGHVRRYRVVGLQGSAPVVDVPLEMGDLPNIYVGLTLLGAEAPPVGAPDDWTSQVSMRQGYVGLSLDTSGMQLKVNVAPQGKGPFLPGSTSMVTVSTRDSNGKPVSGEVSLAVVDEAIFALAQDDTTTLFDSFWSERALGVSTASSFSARDSDLLVLPEVGASPLTGSVAGEEPKKVRIDFRDTAFWKANVTTGADGSATVAVPLPDNLTTWRLTAQAVTADTRFGTSSVPMTVTQPLLLRLVQPRFLTTGDSPHPQAIVQNNTANTLQVEASLVVSGAITLDSKPAAIQRLTVAPGGQGVVTWSARVGQGDTANLRYWVHTVSRRGPAYLEDAVATHLPVKAFAVPEVSATSGEVVGTRAGESILLPYTVSPALGELVVQVSPSLAAATTDGVRYVEEYAYECSEQTTSRYLPLVVLESVYKEQGRKTQFGADLLGIIVRAFRRLADLQQPDGGWGWWEEGPSAWWQTAYVVQGLAAARDAGYQVPGDMLQRGIERLRGFQQDNSPAGIDDTYNLNMRAYTLYVLAYAMGGDDTLRALGADLANQMPRMSNHAYAWLAMSLDKIGMGAESKKALAGLVADVRQSSTTAHWEESKPDYWSMSTDDRATALAIDALVTLDPSSPLIPKAVRWLMSDRTDGHWMSTQDTSISLISLAHYIRQTKELTADYKWQVGVFDRQIGTGTANASNLTQSATVRLPVARMPQNQIGTLALTRSQARGKMYYQVSLRYYVPGEGIKSRSEGLTITRDYYKAGSAPEGNPIREVQAGELVKVRLTLAVPEASYYVMVTDPLPAGLEGVNGSLNTTSYTERPPNPRGIDLSHEDSSSGYGYDYRYYWWGVFDNVEMRDDRTVLFASYISPGTYVYEYFARATTPGVYMSLPAHAEQMYFPDIFGHSDGGTFTVR